MKKVFVSYSRRNLVVVERLARDLQDAGLDVWVDFRKIKGGEAWRQAIYNGIDECDFVIICLSPPAAESEWVRKELEIAATKKKLIIPIMLETAFEEMERHPETKILLDVQIINFANLNYERAFPTLLSSLPGRENTSNYDDIDPSLIPNPFKGLESFQETDNDFFFGRETLIEKSIQRLVSVVESDEAARFMAFVGASGSGKSSVVRAGIIPEIRAGKLPGSDDYPIVIMKPGNHPIEALAARIQPLYKEDGYEELLQRLDGSAESLHQVAGEIMVDAPAEDRFVLVIDQFEEIFIRVEGAEQLHFLNLLHKAVTTQGGRVLVLITMRADFFDRLSHFPNLAALFDHNNLVIVADMNAEELRRTIEGPAIAVGLIYDHGLPDRILEEVLQQAGALPLLQYALSQLFERRDRRLLTWDAYNALGGVKQALAQHAERIYRKMNSAQQDLMQRVLLRLVEVSETGEATRRRVRQDELNFERVSQRALGELLDMLTSAEVRLLVSSRELRSDEDPDETEPTVWIEVVHEALIREWGRFLNWVKDDEENLRLSTEIMKSASDWQNANRDEAYLLTQTRLDRALVWIQTADASDLQREFINASADARRKRESMEREQQAYVSTLEEASRQRLRLIIVVLLIGVVISILLTINSYFSEQRAIAAQNAADEQARLVRSRALAQDVLDVLEEPDTPLALALAVEANSFDNPPAVAQSALAQAAYLGPRHVHEGRSIAEGMVVQSLAYPDESEPLALGISGQNLMVWNIETSEILLQIQWLNNNPIQAAVLSPDGRYVAAIDNQRLAYVWDVQSGEELSHFTNYALQVSTMRFRPNQPQLALAGVDGIVHLWDVTTGMSLRSFSKHEGRVLTLAFSEDGAYLATGGVDNLVRLWDVDSALQLRRLSGHNAWIRSVGFSPDANRIVAGASDGTLFVWNREDGSVIQEIRHAHDGSIVYLDFHPTGESFVSASSDSEIIIWDNRLFTERHRYSDYRSLVSQVIYDSTGQHLLSVGDDARIIEWDVQPGAVLRRYEAHSDWVLDVALSPDGRFALSAGQDGRLLLWDVENATVQHEILGGNIPLTNVAYNPLGTNAIAGLVNGDVLLFDSQTWNAIGVLRGHNEIVRDIQYSPDGYSVLTTGDDGRMILWDIASQRQIRAYEGHSSQIWSAAFTPDGLYVMFGDESGDIGWWNTRTGEVQMLGGEPRHQDSVRSVAISPDGLSALSAADDLSLIRWSLGEGVPVAIEAFEDVPSSRIVSINFSPDSRFALTASDDRRIVMWELESREVIRILQGHVNWVTDVEYSRDGRFAISSSADNSLILWRIDSQAELLQWTLNNREVALLNCTTREIYSVEQQCEDGVVPIATEYPIGTVMVERTAIPSATALNASNPTATLTDLPTPAPTNSPVPSPSPSEFTAILGENRGTLAENNSRDVWLYPAQEGEILNIRLTADIPAASPNRQEFIRHGLDTLLRVYDMEGKLVAESDDLILREDSNSGLEISLSAGVYRIEVSSYQGESSGAYRLIIQQNNP